CCPIPRRTSRKYVTSIAPSDSTPDRSTSLRERLPSATTTSSPARAIACSNWNWGPLRWRLPLLPVPPINTRSTGCWRNTPASTSPPPGCATVDSTGPPSCLPVTALNRWSRHEPAHACPTHLYPAARRAGAARTRRGDDRNRPDQPAPEHPDRPAHP